MTGFCFVINLFLPIVNGSAIFNGLLFFTAIPFPTFETVTSQVNVTPFMNLPIAVNEFINGLMAGVTNGFPVESLQSARNQLTESTDGNTKVEYAFDQSGNRFFKQGDSTLMYTINQYVDYDAREETTTLHIYAGNLKTATIIGEETYYHHTDHLTGSNVETDSSGDTIELLDYFPYGSVRINDITGAYENNYKFTGKELDEATGLLFYHRWHGHSGFRPGRISGIRTDELPYCDRRNPIFGFGWGHNPA